MHPARVPDTDWHWVRERSLCSLDVVFQGLKLDIERDVKERNELRTEDEMFYGFNTTVRPGTIVVSVSGNGVSSSAVTFKLDDRRRTLAVLDSEGKPVFEATLTLTDQRECRFKVKDQELESWQLRKKALDKLFFETV